MIFTALCINVHNGYARIQNIMHRAVSWDRFQKFWQKFTELDLTKGRGWFLNFLGAPMILKC